MIEVYKILYEKEIVDKAKVFQPALDTHGLRGHSQKLFKPRCRTADRKTFFVEQNNRRMEQTALPHVCHRFIISQRLQEPSG